MDDRLRQALGHRPRQGASSCRRRGPVRAPRSSGPRSSPRALCAESSSLVVASFSFAIVVSSSRSPARALLRAKSSSSRPRSARADLAAPDRARVSRLRRRARLPAAETRVRGVTGLSRGCRKRARRGGGCTRALCRCETHKNDRSAPAPPLRGANEPSHRRRRRRRRPRPRWRAAARGVEIAVYGASYLVVSIGAIIAYFLLLDEELVQCVISSSSSSSSSLFLDKELAKCVAPRGLAASPPLARVAASHVPHGRDRPVSRTASRRR